ncbi:MAG: FHA domain-containing protein [Bacteroidaceae bacterium]|nr:FHA domain-containing protein [Bacteroidaceae bacterium]
MASQYKRTLAGSVGAGMGALINGSGRTYYILEHKTSTRLHRAGESQKIIVDQAELGRDKSCQVQFDDSCATVSRKHASIERNGNGWKIVQLSQTNATFVNGRPINGECQLNSGDEIRLSQNGPVMGFIVPQGANSLVKSIGMTERMNLFRQQALKPYKTGIIVIAVCLFLAVGGLLTYSIISNKQHSEQMEDANKRMEIANAEIDALMRRAREASDEIENLNKRAQEANTMIDSLVKEKDAANAALNELTVKADSAEQERMLAMKELDSLKNITNITNEQLQKATDRVRRAEKAAKTAQESADKARNEFIAKTDSAQAQLDSLKAAYVIARDEMIANNERAQQAEARAQAQLDSLSKLADVTKEELDQTKELLEMTASEAIKSQRAVNEANARIEQLEKQSQPAEVELQEGEFFPEP